MRANKMLTVPPGEAAHFVSAVRICAPRTRVAMTDMTSHLMPTYARVNLAFERGEGVWLTATNGERYLDFTSGVAVNALGHAHPHLVAALTEQAQKVWHVSNLYEIPEAERVAQRLVRRQLCRRRVLLQFRRRSDGMRHQDGAQIPVGERRARALSHHHLRRRLPRPHAGDARRRRPEEISRRLRPGGRRLRPGAIRRSRSGQARHRAGDRRDPDRADAWAKAACASSSRRSCGPCASCATSTACCWCSTKCRPAWAAPANCSPPARRRHARHHGARQGARRRLPGRRLSSPPAKPPRA